MGATHATETDVDAFFGKTYEVNGYNVFSVLVRQPTKFAPILSQNSG